MSAVPKGSAVFASGAAGSGRWVDIIVVTANEDIIQPRDGIAIEHSRGEVTRHQVRRDGMRIRPHVTDRKPGLDLAGHAHLVEPDYALLGLADPEEENARAAETGAADVGFAIDLELVGRDEWNPPPGDEG